MSDTKRFVCVIWESDGKEQSVHDLTELVGWLNFDFKPEAMTSLDHIRERYVEPALVQAASMILRHVNKNLTPQ
jgi:hypothetical protein